MSLRPVSLSLGYKRTTSTRGVVSFIVLLLELHVFFKNYFFLIHLGCTQWCYYPLEISTSVGGGYHDEAWWVNFFKC